MDTNDLIQRLKLIKGQSALLGTQFSPEALTNITQGDKLFHRNDFEAARDYYDEAIRHQQTNYYALSQRGKCYMYLNKYDRALEDLFASKEIDSNYDNNNSIALCFLQKEDFGQAIEYFEDTLIKLENLVRIDINNVFGINYNSTVATILNNKSTCHFKLNQFDKAIISTTKGIEANPDYSNNYRVRGTVYLTMGKIQEAQEDLGKALQLGDNFVGILLNEIRNLPNLYQNLMTYSQNGQYDKAIKLTERMRELMPNDDKTYLTLSAVKMEAEDYNGCIEDSEKCISLNPQNAQGWNHLGVAQCCIGNIHAGLDSLRKAIDLGMPGADSNYSYWKSQL